MKALAAASLALVSAVVPLGTAALSRSADDPPTPLPVVLEVSSPVLVDAAHPLIGLGHGKTVVRAAPGYTGDLVTSALPDAHNPGIVVRGVTLDCAGTAARGAYLFEADDLVVEDVEVTGCQSAGPLLGALQARGTGNSDLVQNQRWTDVWVHDNRGTGLHNGLGTRGAYYTRITAERNGGDGLWIGGSEGQVNNLRTRGNAGAGLKLNNLMQMNVYDVQAEGNRYGVQVIELVNAVLSGLVVQNNIKADLFFDPKMLAPPNYGVTRQVLVSGVVGSNSFSVGGYRARRGEEPVLGSTTDVDLSGVLITRGT